VDGIEKIHACQEVNAYIHSHSADLLYSFSHRQVLFTVLALIWFIIIQKQQTDSLLLFFISQIFPWSGIGALPSRYMKLMSRRQACSSFRLE